MQAPAHGKGGASAERTQLFLRSLSDLHVDARLVGGGKELSEALRAVLTKAGAKSVVVAGIPDAHRAAVELATAGLKVDFLDDLRSRPQGEVVRLLSSADAGVTWAVNGVALEGALLEVVDDDSLKLASSLPILHVALVEASSIVPSLADALSLVGGIVAKAPAGRKPVVSFISGPSKTGDIEMRLLYGVHGPHTVCALVLAGR